VSQAPLVQRHLLLCATPSKAKCHQGPLGAQCWDQLKRSLRQSGLENPKREEGVVLRSKVDCLRQCEDGPVMLIWPDGIWYSAMTPERIERIVAEHLLLDQPVERWISRRSKLATRPQ
jgi:(2Fe-2S) ferredoxin